MQMTSNLCRIFSNRIEANRTFLFLLTSFENLLNCHFCVIQTCVILFLCYSMQNGKHLLNELKNKSKKLRKFQQKFQQKLFTNLNKNFNKINTFLFHILSNKRNSIFCKSFHINTIQ